MSYRDDLAGPWRWVRTRFVTWARSPARSRVDRDRAYLWIHAGLLIAGVGLYSHPYGPGALVYYSRHSTIVLAVCICMGSLLALLGALMGTRRWFPSARTDARLPYLFAAGGQISVITSLVTLIWPLARHTDLIGNAMAAVQFAVVCGLGHVVVVAAKEVHRITRLERIVRAEE